MSSTFDGDLTRANLLRLRADFVHAEQICMDLLRSNPKSAAAHSLLGDIAADRGQLEQAAHWYELSLDLDPSSAADRQKLDDVLLQIQERDHIAAAAQLGMTDTRATRSMWLASGAACLMMVAIALGFAVRYGSGRDKHDVQIIKQPIHATKETVVVQTPGAYVAPASIRPVSVPINSVGPEGDSASPDPTTTIDEKSLEVGVIENSKYGSQLVSLVQDPRTNVVLMTYLAGPDDDPRVIGADLAKTLFELTPDPLFVTIRAMRLEKLLYMADVSREKYDETKSEDWQKNNPGDDAWIGYVMTNEWPSKDGRPRVPTMNIPGVEPVDGKDTTSAPSSAGPSSGGTVPQADQTPANKTGI